jgi:CheY-like chemotaxis protein
MTPSRAHVLLVEDDPDDAHFMKRACSKVCPELHLEVAKDGQAAIDRLSGTGGDEKPDYVLLDLKLPKKPGLEVLEWIRTSPGISGLRVMILTSSESESEMQRAKKLGIDAYLVKPVGFPALVELVRQICRDWSIETAHRKNVQTP